MTDLNHYTISIFFEELDSLFTCLNTLTETLDFNEASYSYLIGVQENGFTLNMEVIR